MIDLGSLSATGRPLLMPGAHDALSARLIEDAGFAAYGIGGAALSATQLALPDVGLQSFGEYRDAVARIMEGSRLPLMVDGENGFGDVKATVRTVTSFEKLGVDAIAFEDLVLPPRLGQPPAVVPAEEMIAKLDAALAARRSDDFGIVGRTDSAYAADVDEALRRAALYAATGIDALIVPGLPGLDDFRRLRDAVTIPIIAVVVPGTPWFAPTEEDLIGIGIEAAVYPVAVLTRVVTAIQQGLHTIRNENGAPAAGFDMASMGTHLRVGSWIAIDQRRG